jgi:hypothetical protein
MGLRVDPIDKYVDVIVRGVDVMGGHPLMLATPELTEGAVDRRPYLFLRYAAPVPREHEVIRRISYQGVRLTRDPIHLLWNRFARIEQGRSAHRKGRLKPLDIAIEYGEAREALSALRFNLGDHVGTWMFYRAGSHLSSNQPKMIFYILNLFGRGSFRGAIRDGSRDNSRSDPVHTKRSGFAHIVRAQSVAQSVARSVVDLVMGKRPFAWSKTTWYRSGTNVAKRSDNFYTLRSTNRDALRSTNRGGFVSTEHDRNRSVGDDTIRGGLHALPGGAFDPMFRSGFHGRRRGDSQSDRRSDRRGPIRSGKRGPVRDADMTVAVLPELTENPARFWVDILLLVLAVVAIVSVVLI